MPADLPSVLLCIALTGFALGPEKKFKQWYRSSPVINFRIVTTTIHAASPNPYDLHVRPQHPSAHKASRCARPTAQSCLGGQPQMITQRNRDLDIICPDAVWGH